MDQDITDVVPKGEQAKKDVLVVEPSAAKLSVLLAAMEATVAASGATSFFKFPKPKMGNKYAVVPTREKRQEIAEYNRILDEQKRLRKQQKANRSHVGSVDEDFSKPVLTKAEEEKARQENPM